MRPPMGPGRPPPNNGPMNAHTSIYLVDDSAAIRSRLAEMVGRIEGVRVVGEAASAPEAIVGILATRPDSVVLDLNLERSNGLQVLQAVHPQSPATEFIVLTNHVEPQYRRACERAGAAHFFDKASEFDRVALVVTRIASGRH